jgi:hypothetical protein
MRFLAVLKGDRDSEAGTPPSPELMAKMGDFMEEVTKSGVLLATEGLHPSSKASRVRLNGGKLTVIDGPFAETKEVLASYALFQVSSKQEGIDLTSRFLEILGQGEVDVYPIFEAADFSPELFTPDEAAREDATRRQMATNAQRA